jgi:hypothetical protein
MQHRWPILVAAGVLALGIGGVWYWVTDPGLHEHTDDLARNPDGEIMDEQDAEAARRRELAARARNISDRSLDPLVAPAGPGEWGDGRIDRASATANFDEVMGTVESFARSRERIHKEEWDALYRSANDSFAALSTQLDANDPGDRETLETAHKRLQNGLRRVRVRGKKFSEI